jgi:tRNA dimethylallyltransferase
MPELTFLIGPTAVGKTALGIAWAQKHAGEILYADAPCIFRGMDIGTAKPTLEERSGIPHAGIDWADLHERFTVGDYARRAESVVREATQRGVPLLVLGGSGFYLKSFFEPATDGLGVDIAVSQQVTHALASENLDQLLARLHAACPGDPLEGLDQQNPRRVAKALERVLSSGKPYSKLREEFLNLPKPLNEFSKRVIYLSRNRQDLAARIRLRAQKMLEGGLLKEVKSLEARGLRQNPQAATIIDYRECLDFFDGKITTPEALLETIVADTLALVRKQETFFKQLPVSKRVEIPAHTEADLSAFDA